MSDQKSVPSTKTHSLPNRKQWSNPVNSGRSGRRRQYATRKTRRILFHLGQHDKDGFMMVRKAMKDGITIVGAVHPCLTDPVDEGWLSAVVTHETLHIVLLRVAGDTACTFLDSEFMCGPYDTDWGLGAYIMEMIAPEWFTKGNSFPLCAGTLNCEGHQCGPKMTNFCNRLAYRMCHYSYGALFYSVHKQE